MQGKHPLHQTGQDRLNDVIQDHQEDPVIQDRLEETIQDRQDEMIPDHQEELIQDHQNDPETLDPQDDQKVLRIEKVLKTLTKRFRQNQYNFQLNKIESFGHIFESNGYHHFSYCPSFCINSRCS